MYKVCITNDDGPKNKSLLRLAEVLSQSMEVVVVVPHRQRSGTSKALTLDHPIRILEDSTKHGFRLITHDGFPADSVILACSILERIDLIVSGINAGANVGYHRMLTSGTIGAVLEAVMQGYPALAISHAVSPEYWFTEEGSPNKDERMFSECFRIITKTLERGLPEGIDALNINFPASIQENSQIIVVPPSRVAIKNSLEERVDPYGIPYYWITGGAKQTSSEYDEKEVHENAQITISPIIVEYVTADQLDKVRKFIELDSNPS